MSQGREQRLGRGLQTWPEEILKGEVLTEQGKGELWRLS